MFNLRSSNGGCGKVFRLRYNHRRENLAKPSHHGCRIWLSGSVGFPKSWAFCIGACEARPGDENMRTLPAMGVQLFIEALKSFVIGLVEGITEWLPISSTGHMILVDEFLKLNVSEQFLALFLVVIQIGAIIAVIVLYFHKLNPFSPSKTLRERRSTWRLWGMVVIGCIPAAIVGLLLDDWVHERFYNATVVAMALIAYGIVFIVMECWNRKCEARMGVQVRGRHAKVNLSEEAGPGIFKVETVDDITPKTAIAIGLFQCLAIIPGTSRSGSTIIGGMLVGCSRVASTEFTFFLAIPIMLGWGLVKVAKFAASGMGATSTELCVLAVGTVTAFAVSIVAIKFLIGYIKRNDFTAFGWYRIIVGVIVLGYFGAKASGLF